MRGLSLVNPFEGDALASTLYHADNALLLFALLGVLGLALARVMWTKGASLRANYLPFLTAASFCCLGFLLSVYWAPMVYRAQANTLRELAQSPSACMRTDAVRRRIIFTELPSTDTVTEVFVSHEATNHARSVSVRTTHFEIISLLLKNEGYDLTDMRSCETNAP